MNSVRIAAILVAMAVFTGFAPPQVEASGTSRVKGYVKKKGTMTKPHRRTKPNKKKTDNYGSKGNVNPGTGKAGTKDPFEIDKTAKAGK